MMLSTLLKLSSVAGGERVSGPGAWPANLSFTDHPRGYFRKRWHHGQGSLDELCRPGSEVLWSRRAHPTRLSAPSHSPGSSSGPRGLVSGLPRG